MSSLLPGPQIRYELFHFERKIITWHEHENSPTGGIQKDIHYHWIGKLLYTFSHLEYGISKWFIPQLINKNSKDFTDYRAGRAAMTRMEARDKFMMFTELCISTLADEFKLDKFNSKHQIMQLSKMLVRAAEIRNIVAHAEWVEGFYDYWFVTGYKYNSTTGLYDYVLHRLNIEDLEKAIKYIDNVNDNVLSCWEYIN